MGKANNIAKFLIPKKLRAIFPNAMPITIVGSYLVMLFIVAVVIGVWKNGKYDLSGSYTTTEYFPVNQIIFDNKGHFSAFYATDSYIYAYHGEYGEQSINNYSCYFIADTTSSDNPILGLDATSMAEQCELAVNKVDENTLGVQIISKISYGAWNGKTVYFYK